MIVFIHTIPFGAKMYCSHNADNHKQIFQCYTLKRTFQSYEIFFDMNLFGVK